MPSSQRQMTPLEVSNWELLVMLSFAFILMGIYGYVTFRLDRYVRQKGYQSPFGRIAMVFAFFVAIGLGFYSDWLSPESCWHCSPAANPEYFQPELLWGHVQRFVLRFSVGITLGMIAIAGIALAVPQRARRSGARHVRMPWQAVAYLWLALIPVSLLTVWVWDLSWSSAFRLFVFCCGAYAASSYFAKRMRTGGIKQALQDDPRPPVLYLRAFDSEDKTFALLSYDESQQLGVPIRNLAAWRHPATLEEYFAQEITRSVGPFIALGDPYDYISPGGAEREYFDDNGWQDVFRDLAQQSRFMLMRPEHSGNLLWELQFIRNSGLLGKLFIVTRPVLARRFLPRSWSGQWEKRGWDKFAADLINIGLHVSDYPGQGAVVSFDLAGKSVLVAAHSRTPADYISATQQWCSESSEQGISPA
jgi:hypothetical protein